MCLAIPGKIVEIDIDKQNAVIDYNGLLKTASIMLSPQAKVDDYVLVHAGFIIQILDPDYAADLHQLTEDLGLE
ncbi:MAG: HypC/HybG/HupF family hydrogenase formation chaperone [Firmicutes bacterium]|nr:HypC/HybG/HupF family hydrogenase formation chaperone [Bacillota bacterium]